MEKYTRSSKRLSLDDTVIIIENAIIAEERSIMEYREETDPELKESLKEDAYVKRLVAVRECKLMGKKGYNSEQMDAVMDCTYEELIIPEFDDYKIT